MKINNIKYYLISLTITIYACNNNITDNNINSILVDLENPTKLDSLISPIQLMSDIEFIKLESPEIFFLTEASKIVEMDNKIFILDKNKKIVVAFNKNGSFLGQVGVKGMGPNEYRSANDFDVYPNNNTILIYSSANQEVFEYDKYLSFKRKMKFNLFADQMSVLKNGKIAFYTYFNLDGNNIPVFDNNGQLESKHMPYPTDKTFTVMDFTGFLSSNYYSYPLSSKIFSLEVSIR